MAALSNVSKHVGGLMAYWVPLLGYHRAPPSVIDWETRIVGGGSGDVGGNVNGDGGGNVNGDGSGKVERRWQW